jgi:hypothetical protein
MEKVDQERTSGHRASRYLRAVVLPILFATACATGASRAPTDSAEAVFPTSQELTRAVVVKVLSENGYNVTIEEDGRLIQTGYRQEIGGPWDWLVVYRFGTLRSWVEVRLLPEEESSTHVKVDVYCEGKDSLFGPWRAYDTPLPQRAGTHLRQMRATLELL